ncbi:MAG: hypothetical protein ACTSPB_12570, partial [Candidatus Thorarchaeota archaeon]
LSSYVADLAVFNGYVYAVTVIGGVYRSAGYGDWSHIADISGVGSFDWSFAVVGEFLYVSCPAGIWRSSDGSSFSKVCSGDIRLIGSHAGLLWVYSLNGSLYNSSNGLSYNLVGSLAYPAKCFYSFGDDLYIATATGSAGRVYEYDGSSLSSVDSLNNGAWCLYSWGSNLYSGWGLATSAHGLVRVNAGYSGSPLVFKGISVTHSGPTEVSVDFCLSHAANYTLRYWSTFPLSEVSSSLYRGCHHVLLSGLLENTVYHYNITCFDSSGRRVDSDTLSFNTSARNVLYLSSSFSPYANITDDYDSVVNNSDLHNYTISTTGSSSVVVNDTFSHSSPNSTRFYGHDYESMSAVRPFGGFVVNGSLQSWIYLDPNNYVVWPSYSGGGFWIELWEATNPPYDSPNRELGKIRACWDSIGGYGFYNSSGYKLQSAGWPAWHNVTFWWNSTDLYVVINGTFYSLDWDNSPVRGATHVIFRMNCASIYEVNVNRVYLDDVFLYSSGYLNFSGFSGGVFDRIFSLRGEAFAALNNATNGSLYRYDGSNWSLVHIFPGPIGDCIWHNETGRAYLITSNVDGSNAGGGIWSALPDFSSWSLDLDLSSYPSVYGRWDGFELSGEGVGTRWNYFSGALSPDFDYPLGNQDNSRGHSCRIVDADPNDFCYVESPVAPWGDVEYFQVWFKLDGDPFGYANFSLMNHSDFWINATSDGWGSVNIMDHAGINYWPISVGYWHNLTAKYDPMMGTVQFWIDGSDIWGGPIALNMNAPTSIGFGTYSNSANGSALFDDFREQRMYSFENPIGDLSYASSLAIYDGMVIAGFTTSVWNTTGQGSAVFMYNLTPPNWRLVYTGDGFTKMIGADGDLWVGFSPGSGIVPSGQNFSYLAFFDSLIYDNPDFIPGVDTRSIQGFSPCFVRRFGAGSYVADMVSLASRDAAWNANLPDIVADPSYVRSWLLLMNGSGGFMYGNFTNDSFSCVYSLSDTSGPSLDDSEMIGADRITVNGLDVYVATGSGVWRCNEGLGEEDFDSTPVVFANDSNGLYALEWRGSELLIGSSSNVTGYPCRWILPYVCASGNNASLDAVYSVDGYLSQVLNTSTSGYPHDSYYFFDARSLGDTFLDRRYLCVQFVSHPGLNSALWGDMYIDSLSVWGVRYYDLSDNLDWTDVYLAFYVEMERNSTPVPIVLRGMNSLDPDSDNSSLAFYYGVVNFTHTGWHVVKITVDNGTTIEFPKGSGLSVSPSYWSSGSSSGIPMNRSLSFVDHRTMIVCSPTQDMHFWFDARALGFYNYTNNYSWFRVDIPANNSAAARFCADKMLLRVNESGWYLDIWEGHSYSLAAVGYPSLWPHPVQGGRDEYGVLRPKLFNWSIWFDEDLDPSSSSKFGSDWFTTSSLEWMSDNSSIPVSWPGENANLTINLSGSVSGMD